MRIVFLGTPEFAVASLDALVKQGYNVVGVVTMPDKPANRGHRITYSAVKQYALDNNLRLLQPANLKDKTFLEELKSLEADLQIVVAFRMLPKEVYAMPKMGTFNLHASLLPKYRIVWNNTKLIKPIGIESTKPLQLLKNIITKFVMFDGVILDYRDDIKADELYIFCNSVAAIKSIIKD